ncbi:tape measure protein [Stieleria sp. JC731]|uniref:tape measure protein n=1 Tax=Pirellulaceae TaxID=2691357 RepID=UPI001E4CF773|nr:tape measure protein [Stieleria sp. JC731]MCC9600764.1 tape measure protein [Stieleria sp. JC731]
MSTSLNALTLRINASTEGVSRAVRTVRSDVNKINRIMRETSTESEKAADAQESLNRVYRTGAVSANEYSRAIEAINAKYKQQKNAVSDADQAHSRIRSLVSSTTPMIEKSKEQFRDLFTALRGGKITQEEYARALAKVKEETRKQKDEQSGVAEAARRQAELQQRVAAIVQRSVPATKRLAMQHRELRSEYQAGRVSTLEYQRARRMLNDEIRRTNQANAQANQSNVRQAESLRQLAVKVGAVALAYRGLTAAANKFRNASQTALATEQAEIQFEVFTKSAERARELMTDLKRIDRDSPVFGLPQLMQASNAMLAYGVDADQVSRRVQQLTAISAGNTDAMQRLSLAYAQVEAKGKLMGEEVRQFVNAGFNPLQQIAEDTGESMASLAEKMANGEITVEMVRRAMDRATEAGGRFYGINKKLAASTGGALSRLGNVVEITTAGIQRKFFPAVRDSANAIARMIERTSSWAESLSRTERNIIAFTAALGPSVFIAGKLIAVGQRVIAMLKNWRNIQVSLLALSGPKGWAQLAAGVAIAAGAIYLMDQALEHGRAESEKTASQNAKLEASYKNTAAAATAAKNAANAFTTSRSGGFTKNHQRERDEATKRRWERYDAGERILATIKSQNEALKEQDRLQRMTKDAIEREQLAAASSEKTQVLRLKAMQKERAALLERQEYEKKRLELLEQQRDVLAQQQAKIKGEAEQVTESMRTPFEKLVSDLQRFEEMYQRGLITQRTLSRARSQRAGEFNPQQTAIKVELPPSITKGSREEYRMIAEAQNAASNKQDNQFRQQLAIATAQKIAAEKASRAIAESNRLLADLNKNLKKKRGGGAV